MNITVKGLIKAAVIGTLAYGAGKLATLAKLVQIAKDRPDDLRDCTEALCGMWQTLKEQTEETEDDTDYTAEEAEEEETAPEIQVTSAVDEDTPEDSQPED